MLETSKRQVRLISCLTKAVIDSLRQKIATLEDDNSRISKQLSENNAAFECTLAESDAQHDLE